MSKPMLRDLLEKLEGPDITIEDCKRLIMSQLADAEQTECDGNIAIGLGNLKARLIGQIIDVVKWEQTQDTGEDLGDLLGDDDELPGNVVKIGGV